MSIETATEGVTAALNRAAVERASEGEPTWLVERRAKAWATYEGMPLPSTRSEEWRYTDVKRKLDLDALTLGNDVAPMTDPAAWPRPLREAMEADWDASGHVVEIDGRVVAVDLDPALAERGVILASLRDALRDHEELLERYLATKALPATAGKFQALSAALWTDGVLLFVPRGVELDLPVRVTRWASRPGTAYFTRTLIFADQTSQVSFVDEILSDDFDAQTLHSTALEAFAQDEARVQYVSVQRMGRGVFHLSQQRTLANRGSALDTLNVNLGADVARLDLNAQLLGPGATSDMLGLYFGDERQHFDHNTSQDHVAPHTNSDLLYKGALDDHARSVFRGIIRVHEGAQRTDAYQTNRNLILSDNARADSLPNLEIEADDGRCSHGATVGQLDEDMLFYLMSRGMDRNRAERLVVMGFLGEVLGKLPLGGVTEKVTQVIESKLGHV
jgi:Fe-S cluster assembly protein SufD